MKDKEDNNIGPNTQIVMTVSGLTAYTEALLEANGEYLVDKLRGFAHSEILKRVNDLHKDATERSHQFVAATMKEFAFAAPEKSKVN